MALADTAHDVASSATLAAEELRTTLEATAERVRHTVEQRGSTLVEQARELIAAHPREAIAGAALLAYIVGKLLRGRTYRTIVVEER